MSKMPLLCSAARFGSQESAIPNFTSTNVGWLVNSSFDFLPIEGKVAPWDPTHTGGEELVFRRTIFNWGAMAVARSARCPLVDQAGRPNFIQTSQEVWILWQRDHEEPSKAELTVSPAFFESGANPQDQFPASAQGPFITEQFATSLRYSGASLAYTFAGVVGGGFAPLLIAPLYQTFGTTLAISWYVVAAPRITLAAILAAKETAKRPLEDET